CLGKHTLGKWYIFYFHSCSSITPPQRTAGWVSLLQSLRAPLQAPECRLPLPIHIVFPIDGVTAACTGDSNARSNAVTLHVCLVPRSCHSRSRRCDWRAEWWIDGGR